MFVAFIHGPPASGKLTVAKKLHELTGLPLFHNHLAVDAALSLFEFGSEPFVRLRERIWLDTFHEAARAGCSFIFTFNPEATVRPAFIDAARRIVEDAGGTIHFIELTCPRAEIERRLGDDSRTHFKKLQSVDVFRELVSSGAFEFPPLPDPALTIATDGVAPEEAARLILERLSVEPDT